MKAWLSCSLAEGFPVSSIASPFSFWMLFAGEVDASFHKDSFASCTPLPRLPKTDFFFFPLL